MIAALAGMKNCALAKKALAEKYSLQTLINTGSTRETSKATCSRGKVLTHWVSRLRQATSSGSEGETTEDVTEEIDRQVVRKMRKSRKCSVRRKEEMPKDENPRGSVFTGDRCL